VSLSKGSVIDSFVDATRSTFKITKFIFEPANLSKTFCVSATEIINCGSPFSVFHILVWDFFIITSTSSDGTGDNSDLSMWQYIISPFLYCL
jgi:hypothetical protein